MPKKTYNLVYQSIIEGRDPEIVRKDLAERTKTDPQKLSFLADNKPVTIKKNLDFESASKQQKILEQIGVLCRVESIGGGDDDGANQQAKKAAYTDQGVSYIEANSSPSHDAEKSEDKLSQKEIDRLIEEMMNKK